MRTRAGIIISDPDVDNSADRLKFAVPSNILGYKTVIRIARPKEGELSTSR